MQRTRVELAPHPRNPQPAPDIRIAAAIERTAQGFELCYELAGDLAAIAWPQPTRAERTDGLWQQTCFKAFCAVPGASAYYEFNFSPSTCWAAYRFGGYRERLADPDLAAPPAIATSQSGVLRVLNVSLDTLKLPRIKITTPLEVGLAAVIEGSDSRTHYYSLAHPVDKADFHDRRGFLLTVPGYVGSGN